jgi:hypothetical protein
VRDERTSTSGGDATSGEGERTGVAPAPEWKVDVGVTSVICMHSVPRPLLARLPGAPSGGLWLGEGLRRPHVMRRPGRGVLLTGRTSTGTVGEAGLATERSERGAAVATERQGRRGIVSCGSSPATDRDTVVRQQMSVEELRRWCGTRSGSTRLAGRVRTTPARQEASGRAKQSAALALLRRVRAPVSDGVCDEPSARHEQGDHSVRVRQQGGPRAHT